jgi:thioredoxin reductase
VADLLQPFPAVFDVVIIGGGPAGLSAALVLGRCRRKVVLFDTGQPRNAASRHLHGYLTRDGTPPLELLRLGREELKPYAIETRDVEVTEITCAQDGFDVTLATGERVPTQTVLVATGVRDHVPEIPGIKECYGVSVHHCPYCDGWESRDTTIVVIGHGASATGLGLSLTTWSDRVIVCSNGRRLGSRHRSQLAQHGITVHERPIERVDHEQGQVRQVVLASGETVPCERFFFSAGQSPQSDLAHKLGCDTTFKGIVKTDHLGKTRVPGLYVVGDASRDVQFIVVAAAEGAKAGVAINKALQASSGLAVET